MEGSQVENGLVPRYFIHNNSPGQVMQVSKSLEREREALTRGQLRDRFVWNKKTKSPNGEESH